MNLSYGPPLDDRARAPAPAFGTWLDKTLAATKARATSVASLVCAGLCFGIAVTNAGEPVAPKADSFKAPDTGRLERLTKENAPLRSKQFNPALNPGQTIHTLAPLDLSIVQVKAPNQIGISRPVNISSRHGGRTFVNPDGSQILILAIKSPGAVALRVHFEDFDLPAGDEVYVYGLSEKSTVSGPYAERGAWGDKEFWSSVTEGDTAIVEMHSKGPPGTFRVDRIGHFFDAPEQSPASPDALSCEVDASCSSDFNIEKETVARIVYVDDSTQGHGFCTGTLLTDRAEDRIPYFLTANHCISSQSEARSVVAYWRYRTTSCNSGFLRNDWVTTQGANLMAADATLDYALLNGPPAPPGAWFSGWDPNPVGQNTSVVGLHHPTGGTPPSLESHLRRANGFISGTNPPCLPSGYEVAWTFGIAEKGSSGSGLWSSSDSQHYLIGVLSCGPVPPGCDRPYASYAKFSDIYPQIRPFIDPPPRSNPIDDPTFFVTQHYRDFLNREPDQSGLDYWVNEINSCNGNEQCIDIKRQNVSAAFFLSREFKETGRYVIKLQRAAFGKISHDFTRRITFQQFLSDARAVGAGFVDLQPGADAVLDRNKTSYARSVVDSSAFSARYPSTVTAAGYVDGLFATAEVSPTPEERESAISAFGDGDAAGRAAALRKVAEANTIENAEFRNAFVLMEYFGYLRRNPTDPPDTNDGGYQFWFAKLNSFGGDYIRSEMVRSFIVSIEYRSRFGNP